MLQAERVTFSYSTGALPVLRDISFSVSPGEIVGIIGPNGSGKSTLAKLMLGLLAPSTGRVSVDTEALLALPTEARARRIAAVMQDEPYGFGFRAQEVVGLARDVWNTTHEENTRIVAESLILADATHLATRDIDTLSGGERQRVHLARALAQATPYLVLDEPTSHLDIAHQWRLSTLLRERAAQTGTGIAWIRHDLDAAFRCCDRVLALACGELAAYGPPAEVLTESLCRQVFGVETQRIRDRNGKERLITCDSSSQKA